ncbi:MAG: winged helix-turn-helix transcriptional regulator [Actinobacteria bacterium]|nr:winged helix-turn-helix transcriptional regulator [Actinomycetota bacterium]
MARPLNVSILGALTNAPRSGAELLAAIGDPPRTTAHQRFRELIDLGTLRRRRRSEFPRRSTYELTPTGELMLELSSTVGSWLAAAPSGRIALGSATAQRAINTLLAGWTSSIVATLAENPISLTELDRSVDSIPYPSLERRLFALRQTGLIDVASANAKGIPYEATEWLRRAVVPILAAATFERHLRDTQSLTACEMRAALLLAAPLVRLGPSDALRIALVVHPRPSQDETPGSQRAPIGATIEIREGRATTVSPTVSDDAPNWAMGTAARWSEAVLTGSCLGLRVGGERPEQTSELVEAMAQAFRRPRQPLAGAQKPHAKR